LEHTPNAGGPSAEVLGGLGLLGLIGAVTASNSGKGKGKPAATKVLIQIG